MPFQTEGGMVRMTKSNPSRRVVAPDDVTVTLREGGGGTVVMTGPASSTSVMGALSRTSGSDRASASASCWLPPLHRCVSVDIQYPSIPLSSLPIRPALTAPSRPR
jgi:hypothetical protein